MVARWVAKRVRNRRGDVHGRCHSYGRSSNRRNSRDGRLESYDWTSGAYCFCTPDTINGWGCSNFDGRTLLVNDVSKSCGSMPMPMKYNGYYYFEASAGTYAWASIYWW